MKFTFIFFLIFPLLSAPFYAQNTVEKLPKLIDFGASLKRSPEENLARKKEKLVVKDDDSIVIETNLVVLDFLVLDKKGNAVYGLTKDDFIVTEDKKAQTIDTFTLGDDANVSRSIVLIIDYSGSQFPYIERSVEAAKILVDKLRSNDKMALVTDDVELILESTTDKKLLKDKLESIKETAFSQKLGKSKQFSSLYAVLNELFDDEDVRPIILFQTDGDEFSSLKGGSLEILGSPATFFGRPTPSIANFSSLDLLNLIERKRATIYTIFPGAKLLGLSPKERIEKIRAEIQRSQTFLSNNLPQNSNFPQQTNRPPMTPEQQMKYEEYRKTRMKLMDKHYPNGLPDIQQVLMEMSNYSGGWIDFLEDPEQADGIYSRILSEINTRYVIGYYPSNEAKDGKRRTVKIEVRNKKNYTIWGRKTYIAPLNQ